MLVLLLKNVMLKEGSNAFNKWREYHGFIDFYFFNVTNAEEVVSMNVKPTVEELGPYIYRLNFCSTKSVIH